jgi:hypothetical protein
VKPSWLDMLVYRLFYWRWVPILRRSSVHRELIISWLKAYDVLDEGDTVRLSIERVEA